MLKLLASIAQLVLLIMQNKFEKDKDKRKEKDELFEKAKEAIKNKDASATISILDKLRQK